MESQSSSVLIESSMYGRGRRKLEINISPQQIFANTCVVRGLIHIIKGGIMLSEHDIHTLTQCNPTSVRGLAWACHNDVLSVINAS